MTQLESSFDEFKKRGAGVIVIAAQKIDGLFRGKEHVQKHPYPFPVLFDEDRTATHDYGVYQRFYVDGFNIAHPATFVVAPDGKISWIMVSSKQTERPGTKDILGAIDRLT